MERGSLPVEMAIALILLLGFVYLDRVWTEAGHAPGKPPVATQTAPAPRSNL